MDSKIKQKSDKIFILSFFMILGIVWTHSRLPRWECIPEFLHRIQVLNVFGEDTVSTFFLITGYLFFRNFSLRHYFDKIHTRLNTLIIPYIIWNVLFCVIWYITIAYSGKTYISDNYRYGDFMKVIGNIFSCEYTILWYVGDIIVYALAAPIFFYLEKTRQRGIISIVIIAIASCCFHSPFSSPLLWMSIYMMGAWLGTYEKDFMFKPQPMIITIVALISYPISVWLNETWDIMLTVVIRMWTSAFFFIGIFDLFDKFIHFKPHYIYHYTFFIYAFHYYFIHVLQRYIIFHDSSMIVCLCSYILVPIIVTLLAICIAYILDKKCHRSYTLLTGGR